MRQEGQQDICTCIYIYIRLMCVCVQQSNQGLKIITGSYPDPKGSHLAIIFESCHVLIILYLITIVDSL